MYLNDRIYKGSGDFLVFYKEIKIFFMIFLNLALRRHDKVFKNIIFYDVCTKIRLQIRLHTSGPRTTVFHCAYYAYVLLSLTIFRVNNGRNQRREFLFEKNHLIET